MNAKLTLAMDKKVIETAKKYAAKENTSVSAMVEGFLRNLSEKKSPAEITPIVKSLTGIIKGNVKADWKKDRAVYLEKKYS